MKCQNNLKQIALAVHNYHDANGVLPPNTGLSFDLTKPNWSFLAVILPYIEQENLAKEANIPLGAMNTPGALTAIATQVTSFLCPSDPNNLTGPRTDEFNIGPTPVGLTNYKGVAGANWGNNGDLGNDAGTPAGCDARWQNPSITGSYNGLDQGDGIFFRTNYRCGYKLTSITDGTSNTFMIGEDVPSMNEHCDWPFFNHANGTCGIGPNAVQVDGAPYASSDWPNVYSFHSKHPTGLNFAYADGSVHFVSNSIDLGLYRALATMASGEEVTPP
jgi:prepilin-type processing-associated H-X9-DG protein